MNAERAGMVQAPAKYHWSSYRANALSEKDTVVTPHVDYLALGSKHNKRHYAYRELFRSALEQVHNIRATVQTGTPLANKRFRVKGGGDN